MYSSVVNVVSTVVNEDGNLSLKTSHQYYHQVQGELFISHKQCCDFIVWTPLDFQVIRIVKDNSWEANIDRLIDFYFTVFIPSL
jgi:1,4-alpha-glucan branching enzyme